MSEFKFSCPDCGRHLSGDVRYAGAQITCPACHNTIIVPEAPLPTAPAAQARPVAAAPRAAAPLPARPPTAAPSLPAAGPLPPGNRPRKSGLAIASLVCSIGSFIIIPLGFIPGIICGHMARKRIAANPQLGGAGLAKAGLIVGYVSLGIHVLAVIAVVAFLVMFGAKFAAAVQQVQPMRVTDASAPQRTPAPDSEAAAPIDTTPDGSGWTLKLADVNIPPGPVTGRIHGQKFACEKVTLQGGFLKFSQGADFFPDLGMDAVLFVSGPAELAGKTFKAEGSGQMGMRPHIYMHWKNPGSQSGQQKSWMKDYALQLEFGQPENGRLPAKIYLSVPDAAKSFIQGTFELPLKAP